MQESWVKVQFLKCFSRLWSWEKELQISFDPQVDQKISEVEFITILLKLQAYLK